ncbi:hypothetical protein DRJ00_03905 [Candidatus Aerophobetes bacterium]|uniref:Aspartate ammonia-lyase n=1 Tax=Aerophobetes bacterium TaxID=2030807 RepID=A0A497E4K1_UNCAE|nr:MAG: hypothetical protein DRJ00_03905 [Candidatus Aerophobetes bacterium]
MVTGRDMQLTKMVGEYLVSAELCRRGLLATTFTGNVPDFDIIATNKNLVSIPVQVKTSAKGDWMLCADFFLDINYDEKTKTQKITGMKNLGENLLYVFVKLKDNDVDKDRFYILRAKDLQGIIFNNYDEYLTKHGGRKPKNPKSMHTAIRLEDILGYQDNWNLFIDG